MTPLTIVELRAENLKRIKAVHITPDGNLVVLGGKNGAGKTSVLDTISMVLGGQKEVCKEPLRRGAEHGLGELNLGEIVVKRTFTPGGGGQLTVSNKEGATFRSPQAMLDKMLGKLTFDPLEFSRQHPQKQRETLVALTGIDTLELDVKREQMFTERTLVNRDAKRLAAKVQDMPKHEDVPKELVPLMDLSKEYEHAMEHNRQIAENREAIGELDSKFDELTSHLANIQKQLKDTVAQRGVIEEWLKDRGDEVELDTITAKISEVEATNDKVRDNNIRREVYDELVSTKGRADILTNDIGVSDSLKKKLLRDAQMPVEKLGFAEGGVTLNDLPLEQASAAEQLRVSVAIAIAMNPKLRVLLIRDASLLDEDSLKLVSEMAAEAGAQIWLERVGSDEHTTVLIEDGAVRPQGEP